MTYFQMDRRKYPLSACDKSYSQVSKMRFHERNVHEAKIEDTRCQVCQKVTSIKRHEAIVHNKIKPFECELCQNRFAVKSNLEGHMRSCHNFPKLKCEHCEAQFCYAFSLKTSTRKMLEYPSVFVCPVCNKKFKQERSMKAHDQSAHSGKNLYMKFVEKNCLFKQHKETSQA